MIVGSRCQAVAYPVVLVAVRRRFLDGRRWVGECTQAERRRRRQHAFEPSADQNDHDWITYQKLNFKDGSLFTQSLSSQMGSQKESDILQQNHTKKIFPVKYLFKIVLISIDSDHPPVSFTIIRLRRLMLQRSY